MLQVSLGERFASVKNQILATVVANLCCFASGLAIGWTSPSLPFLRSDESPLASGPISIDTAAWIGSMMPLGGMCGTLIYGSMSNFIGSKRSLLLCALPLTISWIIILYAEHAWVIIGARFLAGLTGGGVFICIPLFVAEIANDRVRGQLSSLLQLNFNAGIVLGYVTGGYLSYFTVPLVLIAVPIVFFAIFMWLPHSPQYLLKNGQNEKAEKSLRYYRNIKSGAGAKNELQLREELEKFVQIAQQNAEMPPVRIEDFLTPEAIRGMLIGITMMACAQFSGTYTLSNYAHTIFRASGSDMDPNVSAIIMGSIQVLGTVCASLLIDRLGRKVLLLISTAGSACALLVTGTYAHLHTSGYDVAALNMLPVVSLSFFIFISAVGITPVPYVMVSEVLPARIRRIGATICVCMVSMFAFIMLRFFPVLLVAMELYGCMWLFACVSTFAFVFTLLVVRETKGMNLDLLQAPVETSKREANELS